MADRSGGPDRLEGTTGRPADGAALVDPARPPRLGARTWWAIVLVGLTGQLAWTVENMFLNLFVYDTITDDPTVIATMVAASAITATLATLMIGAWSDRVGRRRAFIGVGYLLWGVSTAAFGLISPQAFAGVAPALGGVTVAGIAIVVLDCVMTLFGSGANDAAFSAWVTDSTVASNRGRVEGVVAMLPLLSTLLAFGLLSPLTEAGQWQEFFTIVGAAVCAVGVAALFLVQERDTPRAGDRGVLRAIGREMSPAAVRGNPNLYLAMCAILVCNVAAQIFMPYMLIYLQRYLRFEAWVLVMAIVLVGAAAVSVLGGRVIDRIGKVHALAPSAGVYVVGLAAMFLARSFWAVCAAGLVAISGMMLVTACAGATIRDHTVPGRAGAVQGVRMIFAVLVPMVVGPFVGAAVISGAQEYYEDLGVLKQVPTPGIYLAAAITAVLLVVPWALLRRRGVR